MAQDDKVAQDVDMPLIVPHSGMGQTRAAQVRPTPNCHPEPMVKDLCPGESGQGSANPRASLRR